MENILQTKKVALVHDYLLGIGGAERVLKVLHEMFPAAPIYSVVYDRKFVQELLGDCHERTCSKLAKGSFLQKLPFFLRKRYKYFSFLIPTAVEQMDLSEFDVVISSCSAFCKGVITRPDAIHVSYCHTPTRFLWDWAHPYLRSMNSGRFMSIVGKITLHFLRLWDQQAAHRVDYFVANSKHVAARIKKYYGRDAMVIYPAVESLEEDGERDTDSLAHSQPSSDGLRGSSGFAPTTDSISIMKSETMPKSPSNPLKNSITLPVNPYFLIVSQLRPYKQIDVAIIAFRNLGFPLVIIGKGNDKKRLQSLAAGCKNITFLGSPSDEIVAEYYRNCKALIFPGEEDFGMTMVEAMLFGKPVLALRVGGAKEIVVEGITGEFFDEAHHVVLADGMRRLLDNYDQYSPTVIRRRAEKFSRDRFTSELLEFIERRCTIK